MSEYFRQFVGICGVVCAVLGIGVKVTGMRDDFQNEIVPPNLLLCDGDVVRRKVASVGKAVFEKFVSIKLCVCRKFGIKLVSSEDIVAYVEKRLKDVFWPEV